MKIDAETYRQAALEHIHGAHDLYAADYYLLTHYVAGLAVECIFRAFWYRIDPEFDRRQHDLRVQYKSSRFAARIPEPLLPQVSAALGDVSTRWLSVHRYGSEAALRSYLKRMRKDRGIRGDFLKENARQILNAATEIVNVGARR